MNTPSGPLTSPTLLGRLRAAPTDEAAWVAFVERYGRRIYTWARHWNLQHADAEDVAQMVLARLARRLPNFVYDEGGTFRGWLWTLTRHAWSDFLHARERSGRGSGDSGVLAYLESAEAGDDLAARLAQEFDEELLEAAMARVQLRVAPSSWDAFRLTALEGQSGASAASQLGMPITSVFKARSRVQQMLQDEVRKLDRGES